VAEVTCLGVLVADLVARPVDHCPEKGKLLPVEEMRLHTGGGAANTAVVLRRLGVSSAVIGRVGTDELGDFVIKSLGREGVDVAGIRRDREKGTGCSMVLTAPDGERSFISTMGANLALSGGDINWEGLQTSRILHLGYAMLLPALSGESAALLLKKARELGLTTSVDTAWDYTGCWWESLAPCLPYTDLLFPSLTEAQMLTGRSEPGEMARVFLEAGVGVVAIKRGEMGSYVCNREVEFHVPPFAVRCVDATGAGDAYVAGFLAGHLQGLTLEETARLANAAGALATTATGATGGVSGMGAIRALLKDWPEAVQV